MVSLCCLQNPASKIPPKSFGLHPLLRELSVVCTQMKFYRFWVFFVNFDMFLFSLFDSFGWFAWYLSKLGTFLNIIFCIHSSSLQMFDDLYMTEYVATVFLAMRDVRMCKSCSFSLLICSLSLDLFHIITFSDKKIKKNYIWF